MSLDLAEELEQIERHIPHLEAAARDESAPALVRAGVVAELAVWRLAADLAGHDRTASEQPGTNRNATKQLGTEAGRDA
jgi:hypothetical protein